MNSKPGRRSPRSSTPRATTATTASGESGATAPDPRAGVLHQLLEDVAPPADMAIGASGISPPELAARLREARRAAAPEALVSPVSALPAPSSGASLSAEGDSSSVTEAGSGVEPPAPEVVTHAVLSLLEKMRHTPTASRDDLDHLRGLAMLPGGERVASELREAVLQSTAAVIANAGMQGAILVDADATRRALGYDDAPPAERIVVEDVCRARVRLLIAELALSYAQRDPESGIAVLRIREHGLARAQYGYTRGLELLYRIRRLCRRDPRLQINIVRDSARQLNIGGDVGSGVATGCSAAPAFGDN